MRITGPGFLGLIVGALLATPCVAQDANIPLELDWAVYQKLWLPDLPKATADEPRLPVYSERQAAHFLDRFALEWTRQNQCGTCHTNVPALMARPLIRSVPGQAVSREIRSRMLDYADELRRKFDETTMSLLVPVASAVAINAAESGRALEPRVRELLDFIWTHQSEDGSWIYPIRPYLVPFLERDRTYLAMLAALAAGYVPGYFQERPDAQVHLENLKKFLREHAPASLHHQAVLLWASVRLGGLLEPQQQANIAAALLDHQNPDGGWTLAALGTWPRHDGAPNDPHAASDGYATGLATLVLCERGASANSPPIRQALTWLESNQRESGRWFTRSLYSDGFKNYLSNMATAYAVMAIQRCTVRSP